MKRLFLYIVAIVMFSTSSCSDFLTISPVGALDEKAFLSQEGVSQLLVGMYGYTLYSNSYFAGSFTNYAYGDVMGGSANKGTIFAGQPTFTIIELYQTTADNAYLETKWGRCYDGVYRANSVISAANKIKDELSAAQGESKDFYTETIAQARFIRALSHFEAVKLFGAAVPYVSDLDYESSTNPKVSNVDESGNYIYIWDKVIEDFQYAYDNLPNTWSKDKGLPNKWAAAGFLAKVKLYRSSPYDGLNGTSANWADVKSLLETIIANGIDNNGTKFKLADTYETLWIAAESDWTGESVFDIQTVISGTSTIPNSLYGAPDIGLVGALGSGGWGFFQPSNEMVNSHIVDANGLPLLNKSYQDLPVLTQAYNAIPKTDLTVYTDPRLDVSVGRFNVPYWDWAIPTTVDGWIRDPSNGGYYLNKKPQPKKSDKGSLSVSTVSSSTAKNFHLLRYADILLMYAECLIETGDFEGARTYINMIRSRAANGYIQAADPGTMEPTTSSYVFEDKVNGTTKANAAANYRIGLYPASQFTTKEGATAALRFERKIEIGLEGHRWYDLARWGIVVDEINDYLNYEKQYLGKFSSSVYNSRWYTMPIPYNQIIKMEGLLVQDQRWQ